MAATPWEPCGAPTGDDAMDDLGKMLGSLGGGTGDTGGSPDLAAALGSLTGGEGGLEGLLAQLSNGGLGDEVGSWVGTGPNQPVDPQRLGSALGPDAVNQLSSKTGLDVGSLLPMLAAFLPQIINALTPDGKVPAGGAGGGIDIGSILAGLGGSARSTGAPAMGSDPSVGDIGSILDGK